MNKTKLSTLLCTLLAGTLSDKKLTREQLDMLLAELVEKPTPEETGAVFASCYMRSAPTDRIEYVCPTCGEKTLYANCAAATVKEVQRYHEQGCDEVCQLGLDVTLDERTLCASCKKTIGIADDKLKFYVEIRVDKKITRTLLKNNDWEKLIAFLKGENTWNHSHTRNSIDFFRRYFDKGDFDEEHEEDEKEKEVREIDEGDEGDEKEEKYTYLLKPEIPRIRALLGLDEKATEEKSAPVAKEENTP